MSYLPFVRLETHGTCRADLQDTLVVDYGSMRVIELPPARVDVAMPRRELPPAAGLLAALVIAGSLLDIVHDDTPPAHPAMGAAAAPRAQG